MLNTKQLADLIDSASRLRTRLVWLVGMPGADKTRELKALAADQPDCEYVNLNATLANRLAGDLPDQQPFKVGQHLSSILPSRSTGSWLIDNIEILFSRKLKIRVVDRLNSLAQQATLVVAWPGSIENGRLTYGARNHPDFAEYPIDSPLVLDLNTINSQGK
jgi:hypothetical protein